MDEKSHIPDQTQYTPDGTPNSFRLKTPEEIYKDKMQEKDKLEKMHHYALTNAKDILSDPDKFHLFSTRIEEQRKKAEFGSWYLKGLIGKMVETVKDDNKFLQRLLKLHGEHHKGISAYIWKTAIDNIKDDKRLLAIFKDDSNPDRIRLYTLQFIQNENILKEIKENAKGYKNTIERGGDLDSAGRFSKQVYDTLDH